MKTIKKLFLIPLSIILILGAISLTSAGFSDFWAKITGRATSDTTALNITVGNSAPTIPIVQAISAQTPTDDSTTSVVFNFSAVDTDGAANINASTTNATFMKSGEALRTNLSCANWGSSGNMANFTCTILMYYFDGAGSWTVNVSIKDINSATGVNSSTTFTYNVHTGMKMTPTSLNWPPIGLSSTDTGSSNDPILINNTGNDVTLNINVTSYDLRGEITTTQFIYANNFTVENANPGCSGTAMVNASSRNVTSAILNPGNHSINDGTTGQEQIYFCLKGVPQGISAQSYSSAAIGPWTVEIN